ncbi:CPBP family intramembrane metalloprotease, partial [Mesorhizobium sp. M00.F.Ca.ET.158.01.1.1]
MGSRTSGTIDENAFERYRNGPNARTTLPRLLLGTLIVVPFWGATTAAVLFGGSHVYFAWQAAASPYGMEGFLASPIGILSALTSFAG